MANSPSISKPDISKYTKKRSRNEQKKTSEHIDKYFVIFDYHC